jgi:hypothetical protein
MKIEDKDDKPNTGRLHVDYAQARDDQYEFECKQRMLAREMRHRQRMEDDRLRPPSPPPIVHYSDHEAYVLMEQLKCAYFETSCTRNNAVLLLRFLFCHRKIKRLWGTRTLSVHYLMKSGS